MHHFSAAGNRAGHEGRVCRGADVIILEAERLSVAFGGVRAIDEVSLAIEAGLVFSIIGPNGAGKTTLFNVFSGLYLPLDGRVSFAGQDVTGFAPDRLARCGLSRTFQNLQIFFRMTVLENVMVGRHRHEASGILSDLLHLPAVARQNRRTREAARSALARVGLEAESERPAASLAYGALKRLEIARALASEPKALLLDEPAAGCNPVETAALERVIRSIVQDGVTIVLVEHDMRLVMNISDRIHVLASGRSLAEGTAAEVRSNPAVVEAYLGIHGSQEAAHALG
jgi:branched-chain amino acid transport system ATP-binding protein